MKDLPGGHVIAEEISSCWSFVYHLHLHARGFSDSEVATEIATFRRKSKNEESRLPVYYVQTSSSREVHAPIQEVMILSQPEFFLATRQLEAGTELRKCRIAPRMPKRYASTTEKEKSVDYLRTIPRIAAHLPSLLY